MVKILVFLLSIISTIIGSIFDYNQITLTQFEKFDTNSDGYLDKEELAGFHDQILLNLELFKETLKYDKDAIFYNIWINGKVTEGRKLQDAEKVNFGQLKVHSCFA